MTNIEAFVKLGRFMITHASQFVDDTRCNRWARVGQLLTEMGMPFAPKLSELGSEQIATVREAASVMAGKLEMPVKFSVRDTLEPRRTRKARMTKAMTKPKAVKPKAVKPQAVKPKAVKADSHKTAKNSLIQAPVVKRGRGRPRKVVVA
jgi:hypothetical protein